MNYVLKNRLQEFEHLYTVTPQFFAFALCFMDFLNRSRVELLDTTDVCSNNNNNGPTLLNNNDEILL
jgi:hypothetical protein